MNSKEILEIEDTIKLLIDNNKFIILDELLCVMALRCWRTPIKLLKKYSELTFPIKNKLKNRDRFLKCCCNQYPNLKL